MFISVTRITDDNVSFSLLDLNWRSRCFPDCKSRKWNSRPADWIWPVAPFYVTQRVFELDWVYWNNVFKRKKSHSKWNSSFHHCLLNCCISHMNSSHCEFCGEKKCREFQQGAFKNKLTIVSYKAHSQAAAECIPRAVGGKNTDSTVGIFFFQHLSSSLAINSEFIGCQDWAWTPDR